MKQDRQVAGLIILFLMNHEVSYGNGVVSSIPVMQLRDGYVLVYYQSLYSRRWSNNLVNRFRVAQVRSKAYSGDISNGGRKRMARAITLMSQCIKPKWIFNEVTGRMQLHRFSFITLTVASDKNLTAKQGHDLLLSHFLAWLRRTKNVKLYVWKAEYQERGQIHYHITIPDFIHYREIRDKWNTLQKNAGLLDEYALKHKHFNPNSTDIHDTRDVRKMKSYIMKEMGKSVSAKKVKATKIVDSLIKAGELPKEKRTEFIVEYAQDFNKYEGKVWDCSDNLSGASYFSLPMEHRHELLINKLKNDGVSKEKGNDFYYMIFFGDGSPPDLLNENERLDFDRHIDRILNGEPEIVMQPVDHAERILEQVFEPEVEAQAWKPYQIDLF